MPTPPVPTSSTDPYALLIGDRAYSSWSMRGWLAFDAFDIPVSVTLTQLYDPRFVRDLAAFAPARSVPALRLPGGPCIGDSLAIAEELANRHPDAGHWPQDPALRARARALAAEMHASFTALRGHCAMNLRRAYADCAPTDAVLADLARIEALWEGALTESGGPWLCGDYSMADAFFAPVAARIAGHSLPVSDRARAYVQRHLNHLPFRRWRAMALVAGPDQATYDRDWPEISPDVLGPTPAPLRGAACAQGYDGPSVNTACPYSGRPVTHFARVQDQVIGFCNAFCRDKTAADPQAWPQAMALLQP